MASHHQPPSATSSLKTTSDHEDAPILPHIPGELLLLIFEFVPATHILPFRSVCRSIKKHIDTSIFKSYLHRMTFVAYEPHFRPYGYIDGRPEEVSHILPFVKIKYSHMADKSQDSSIPNDCAILKVDPEWLTLCTPWIDGGIHDRIVYDFLFNIRSHMGPDPSKELRWFVHLDSIALPLDVGISTLDESDGSIYKWSQGHFHIDCDSKTISIDWRLMLRNMLTLEAEITRKVHAHGPKTGGGIDDMLEILSQPLWSRYDPLEDVICATHREHIMRHCQHPWTKGQVRHIISGLRGLFGQPNPNSAHGLTKIVRAHHNEQCMMRNIKRLRRGG